MTSKRSIYIWKLTCLYVFLNKREDVSRFFRKSNIFKYISTCQTRSKHLWTMNAMCTLLYFRCILFFCSCYLSKHPSLCELFWYLNPDDGYWNQNVQRRLYIIINSPIWIIYIFLCLRTVGFWSRFTFIYSYICIFIYLYIFLYIYIYICIFIYIFVYIYIYIYTYWYVYIFIHICIYIFIHIHIYTYIHLLYIYIYIYIYIFM